MCGIAGQVKFGGKVSPGARFHRDYLEHIGHRGPDFNSQFVSDEVIFSHTRLSVIDLSSNGNQPFEDSENVLIFNGEIYNYKEIMKKYGIQDVVSQSDTEILFKILKKVGISIVSELRGMFAFAFYDKISKYVYLARDHLGQKPLFYSYVGRDLIFSSNPKHLMLEVGTKISAEGMVLYEAFQFNFGGRTILENIKEVPPGHYLVLQENGLRLEKYWTPLIEQNRLYNADEFDSILSTAIERCFIADVPIGITVSGGLDSSTIAGYAAEKIEFNLYHGRYSNENGCDESFWAESQAKHIGKELNVIELSASQFNHDFESTINSLGVPTAGPGAVGQYAVNREIAKNCTVTIGGQGGDEIFAGYARYFLMKDEYHNLPILKNYSEVAKRVLGTNSNIEKYFQIMLRNRSDSDTKTKIKNRTAFEIFHEWVSLQLPDHKSLDPISLSMLIDQITFLPSLMHVDDSVTMCHGLESRTPFLDVDLVEYVNGISTTEKISEGPKTILKSFAKDYVAASILNRKDKMGFPLPLNSWIESKQVPNFIKYLDSIEVIGTWERQSWGRASINSYFSAIGITQSE